MASLSVNSTAPTFRLPASDGTEVSLKDFLGKNVVLYFYPKNNTPGCTLEACHFRDNLARLQNKNTVVLGVSKDSIKSHQNFKQRFNLPFLLLSDESTEMMQSYGVWQEKSMFGKKYMGIQRSTFLVDGSGIIRRIWSKVKVKGHVDEVLKAVEEL